MKLALATLALALFVPQLARAQAADIPSAAPATTPGTDTERGLALIDAMVKAIGGDAWLNRTNMQIEGRGSIFFHGEPDIGVSEYQEIHRYSPSEADRIGFLISRGALLPGKKIDVVQIMKDNHGYEITYKGLTELPQDQVDDYNRRRAHSIETVVNDWIKQPGVMIIAQSSAMLDRRIVDKVTVLTANNDAVTLDLDADTHLPRRRTFQWRNPQFNDFDVEQETYDDYHTVQGLPTPYSITRYHNGEMTSQRYITKVAYNVPADAPTFDQNAVTVKLKK